MKVLHIDSSITGPQSVSRQLSQETVEHWLAHHPEAQVEYLDLALAAPKPLSRDALGFRMSLGDSPTEQQARENATSEAAVTQLLSADVIVIGAPLYNFTIPAQLKAWLDRIAQAGRTFKYTENGPVGLLGDKTVILVLSRGGVYSSTEAGQAMSKRLACSWADC